MNPSSPVSGEYSPITRVPTTPVDGRKADHESDYEIVSSAAVSMASETRERPPSSESKASLGRSWVRPLLARAVSVTAAQMRSLIPGSLALWTGRKKQKKQASRDGEGEDKGKEAAGQVLVDFADPLPSASRTRCQSSPLILINGSFMVGKSAVARDVAQMLASQGVKSSRTRASEMRGGPVEVHGGGRVEVLHMNEMYNTIRHICRRSESSSSSGPGVLRRSSRNSRSSRGSRGSRSSQTSKKNSKAEGPCGCSTTCPLAMLDLDKAALDKFRTETLFESVVSSDREDVTVLVTDSLPFSEENSNTVQQYRVAARVSDRPFIHVYLICAAMGRLRRLDSRTMCCQAHQLAGSRPKRPSSSRSKGKEKAEAPEGPGGYVATRLDELQQQVVDAQEDEFRWLPVLFPTSPGRLDEGSSSAAGLMQRCVSQFRGFLVDTTDATIHETALAILDHVNDVQNGVVCTDAEETV